MLEEVASAGGNRVVVERRRSHREDAEMKQDVRWKLRCVILLGLLAAPAAATPAVAQSPPPPWAVPLQLVADSDATLYEATENERFIGRIGKLLAARQTSPRAFKATSQLMGVARRGSPFCPATVPGTGHCTVNATGSDSVDLVTGLGSLTGTFTVVVQDTSPEVDSPELVVMKGRFTGKIDFTPALFERLPFGTATGHVAVAGGGTFPFTGVFRQPVGDSSFPVYYTGNLPGSPTFTLVQPNEFALSFATVRFEIKLQQ